MPILSGATKARATGRSRRRASRLRSRPSLEPLETRVVLYSASGNAWPAPQLVTLSFMPDGTNINGKVSNLQATFNARFGSTSAWQNIIIKAAQTWAAQTNLNFAVVADNGAAEGSGSYQQGDPGFGDIRIGGYNFNATTLAQAFMPPPVNNYSAAGDIQFNTGQAFNNGTTYDLFTVAVHELGHALGLYHSGIASAEEYSSYNGVKNSLTGDDIAGIQSIYSGGAKRAADPYFNTTGSTPNFATAYDISSAINATTLTGQITNGTISTAGGSDLFSFIVPSGAAGNTLRVAVQSQGLSLLTPGFAVYNASQSQIASAQGVATGDTITSTWSGLTAGSKLYVKVFSPVTTAFGIGAYALTLNLGTNASPAVSPPITTRPNGTPLSSGGGQADMVNTETLASSTTEINPSWSGETRQDVAMDAGGNFVVVWEAANADDSGGGIYAQRFDSTGARVGGEFRVNTSIADFRGVPAVAVDASGNFVVTWSSKGQDGSGLGVYAQRYDATGARVGGEFRVNTTTADDQTDSVPALDAAGNLVVTWASHNQDGSGWGIYARRYDPNGRAVGPEFRVNTTSQDDQQFPSVAAFPGGGFVVTWASKNQDGSGWGVYAQRYDTNGARVGGETRVNTTNAGDQIAPAVTANAAGSFAITWSSSSQDGGGWGVYAQRYDTNGTPIGGEFQVNTSTANNQEDSSASLDNAGDLLITWFDTGGKVGVANIKGQQYAPDGTPLGDEFQVNNSTGYLQQYPSMAMNNQGQVVVAWCGASAAVSKGIFFQQFTISFAADSVDGFFAQGDPSDPDQASTPAAPAPVSAGPILVAPSPAAPVAASPGDVGSVPQFLPPTPASQALGQAGPASRLRPSQHDPRLEVWSVRYRPSPRPSHADGHRVVPGLRGHTGEGPAVPTVGHQHPWGHAARPAGGRGLRAPPPAAGHG